MSDALYREYPAVYDALYADKPYDEEVEFVTDFVAAGGRILVVGCGTGEHSRRLRDRGYDVVGVDPSEAMLERARKKSDADFVLGSLPELPVDGTCDLVFVPFTVVNHLEHGTVDASLETLVDRLAPGGTLVLDTMWVPEDGTDLTLGVHERPEGDYARLHQIHVRDVDAGTYRWDSIVFTPDGSWFADTHDLIDAPAEAIVELLEERGLAVEIYDGYREADGWPATVVVARRE
ncbi:class I SAM-dependent methyltransferase [Halosolutus halophilus]|uniref:class I SAM-dependent methyltransferase n=1 Tax=Halosolutus halophilus TaxID=1552990 RepID=UPI0022350538|nr:class I SAM-dependent methyltransferase [Halosolutus halophilus]